MSLGLIAALPCALLPLLLQPVAEREKPLSQRYWVKANAWIAVFSFIGNYFWTHYFYRVLGATYTFPAHNLNQASCLHREPGVWAGLWAQQPAASQLPTSGWLQTCPHKYGAHAMPCCRCPSHSTS